MSWKIDARIPVAIERILPEIPGQVALLAEATLPDGVSDATPRAVFRADDRAHLVDCACCSGLGAAAAALAALFRARASGQWFTRVVALVRSDEGEAELDNALRRDILTVARFRRA
jgi:hypothetical protein